MKHILYIITCLIFGMLGGFVLIFSNSNGNLNITNDIVENSIQEIKVFDETRDKTSIKKGEMLFKDPTNLCSACHHITQKIVGPSLRDIKERYKGKDISNILVAKIQNGGFGNWGQISMPPSQIEKEKIEKIVDWILDN